MDDLKVGDLAPDCFGNMKPVTRIYYRLTTRDGNRAVGYYTKLGDSDNDQNGCGVSNSMVEGKLMRDVRVTGLLNSAECDALDDEISAVAPLRRVV